MTVDDISLAAATGAKISDAEPADVRAVYWQLVSIYRDFSDGRISKSAGAKAKNEAVRRFRSDEADRVVADRCVKGTAKLWKNTELASSAYALDRTLENADRLWAVIRNLPADAKPTTPSKKIWGE